MPNKNIFCLATVRQIDMPKLQRLPLTVQTAYADLLARIQEDTVLEIEGTPTLRERGGRKYWYAIQRYASNTVETYLGPDTEELRERIERVRELNEDRKRRAKQRSDLVRMCREGGVPNVDGQTGKVLRALAKAGAFRLRAVVVGTHAFRCYPGLLGARMPEAIAVTEDIDVAAFQSIAIALDAYLDPALGEALRQIGPFDDRPNLYQHPTAWRDAENETLVELLTPNEGADRDEPLEMPALGAFARPLRFLDYLIHEPIQAVVLYRSGVLINVPQPARYAIHKLIVATRRVQNAQIKAAKDIAQATELIRVLSEDRPDDLEAAYREAMERGPSWRRHLEQGIRRLPAEARERLVDAIDPG